MTTARKFDSNVAKGFAELRIAQPELWETVSVSLSEGELAKVDEFYGPMLVVHRAELISEFLISEDARDAEFPEHLDRFLVGAHAVAETIGSVVKSETKNQRGQGNKSYTVRRVEIPLEGETLRIWLQSDPE